MTTSEQLEEDMTHILDLFSGADGGVGFAVMNMRLRNVAKDLDEGKIKPELRFKAVEILELVTSFRKLMDKLAVHT